MVFKEGSDIIEIPHGIGQRAEFIDILIVYFEEIEEYEKCEKLVKSVGRIFVEIVLIEL